MRGYSTLGRFPIQFYKDGKLYRESEQTVYRHQITHELFVRKFKQYHSVKMGGPSVYKEGALRVYLP